MAATHGQHRKDRSDEQRDQERGDRAQAALVEPGGERAAEVDADDKRHNERSQLRLRHARARARNGDWVHVQELRFGV